MYRKKTLLLNECNNANKPIGIAVLVADQRRTAVRVSVKGVARQNAYLFVDADDVKSCKKFTTSVGTEFFTSPTLLERVSCLILTQDLIPLCFASSIGQSLDKEILARATECVKSTYFEQNQKNQSLNTFDEIKENTNIDNSDKNLPKEVLCTTTETLPQQKVDFFDAFTSLPQKNLALDFNGNYDQFVIATQNYYDTDGIQPKLDQKDQNKAKVSLSAYKKALEEYYQNQDTKESYLKSVANELQEVFDNFLPYHPLMKKIEDSFFVKVTYDKDNFFGLGVLNDKDEPRYICYALPIKQKEQNPFLTVSVDEEDKRINFCLIMQSAKDGKIFKAVG
ncbi:MAG: hypothetical protein IKV38_00380 [Clostridia bacterium]|nr:hypothetical protein [Clostridia bacterium]